MEEIAAAWTTFAFAETDTVAMTFDEAVLSHVAAPTPALPLLEPLVGRAFLCGFFGDCTQVGNVTLSGFPGEVFASRYFPVAGTHEYTMTPNVRGSVPA